MKQSISVLSTVPLTHAEFIAFDENLKQGELVVTGFECLLEGCFSTPEGIKEFRNYFYRTNHVPKAIVIPENYQESVKAVFEFTGQVRVHSEKELIDLFADIVSKLSVDIYFEAKVILQLVVHHEKATFPCKPYYIRPVPIENLLEDMKQIRICSRIDSFRGLHIADLPADAKEIWKNQILEFLERLEQKPISVEVQKNEIIVEWAGTNVIQAERLFYYLASLSNSGV
ncbi:hypothetical protein FB479_111127 [Brevibacillus sp. AG162]|uniref:hypothetical protein n=1 Tax=Brevibacillus sp. AG162 TaxID=2572910 RepID=UPI001152C379|nr:hypothetical protein [Brevibacillus sp. AG162]TQK53307.1 hypothetical protein FB479_111127 [Brevibacillus sp. AG162]